MEQDYHPKDVANDEAKGDAGSERSWKWACVWRRHVPRLHPRSLAAGEHSEYGAMNFDDHCSSYSWFLSCRACWRYRSEASDRTADELAMTYGPSVPTRGK